MKLTIKYKKLRRISNVKMANEKQMPPPMAPPPAMNPGPSVATVPPMAPPPISANNSNPPNMNAAEAPSFPKSPENASEKTSTIEEIEEVVETIIDERWKEVTENIKKVLDWKTTMDEKFIKMEENIKNLKDDFSGLYKAIVGKVGDYDQNILKVDTELKALEKVFSQVLPVFTANVNELSRVTEDITKHHKKKD